MKIFLKFFSIPLLIAIIASALFIFDSLISNLFIKGSSFMWVSFAIWTIFYTSKLKDRIKGLIGVIIGFIFSILMMAITNSFHLNIFTISISCLLGVFIVNFIVMFMDKLKNIWLDSITGAFTGIFLTFSGLGVGLNPISNVKESFIMFGIIITYTCLGLMCGFLSTYFTNKINKKLSEC